MPWKRPAACWAAHQRGMEELGFVTPMELKRCSSRVYVGKVGNMACQVLSTLKSGTCRGHLEVTTWTSILVVIQGAGLDATPGAIVMAIVFPYLGR